jgi:hypothetical protein
MIRRGRPTSFVLFTSTLAVVVFSFALRATPALADEEDDLQRQVDTQKAGVPDLEHLDTQHAARADIQRLRQWLGEAWDLRNKHDPDGAREVLDRCLAQAELIRQIIAASQAKADLAAREAKLLKTKQTIEQTKQALVDAQAKKKSLEQVVGS